MEPRITVTGHATRIGSPELGDTIVAVIEVECTAEGRRRNGKAGTIDTRTLTVKDFLPLPTDLSPELLTEIRRHRREAEEEETGVPVIAGLEGWLDGSGVVVTDADQGPDRGAPALEVDEDGRAILEWLALAQTVAGLRAAVEAGGKDALDHQVNLDALFSELNALTAGEEVVDTDDDGRIILDDQGDWRPVIELPDLDILLADTEDRAVDVDLLEEPFDGYRDLTVPAIIDHVDDYLRTDRELGGPSEAARRLVANVLDYERALGTRTVIIEYLEPTLAALELEHTSEAPADTGGPPWADYDGMTADSIIDILRAKAETDPADARDVIRHVDRYEAAHKARKGVLNRLAAILPPELPDGPDLDLELDDEDFEPNDDEADA